MNFKKQMIQVQNFIANDRHEYIGNRLLAELNDVAYKSVRKANLQKKLNERAMKNATMNETLQKQLDEEHSSIDFEKVGIDRKEFIEKIGICTISQMDTLECLKEKDCMCLGLEISRSEATINDPSKLIIREVHPTFLSLDSFLESSIFNLKCNQDSSGGFEYDKQGELAIGAGRESISGALPLFLFKEHWKVAQRKI